MKETLRTMVAGGTGAVLAAAVLLGQPALAGVHLKTAAKNSVTSKSIKNGTVKGKDLDATTNASLAKANSALQGIPANSVTGAGIADGSVGSADVQDNSLAAGDLAANSVGSSELGSNSVGAGNITNHSLTVADFAAANGVVSHDFASIGANSCSHFAVSVSPTIVVKDIVLASGDGTLADGLTVSGRPAALPSLTSIDIYVCNETAAAINPDNTDFTWAVLDGNNGAS